MNVLFPGEEQFLCPAFLHHHSSLCRDEVLWTFPIHTGMFTGVLLWCLHLGVHSSKIL